MSISRGIFFLQKKLVKDATQPVHRASCWVSILLLNLNNVLASFLLYCVQLHVIFDRDISTINRIAKIWYCLYVALFIVWKCCSCPNSIWYKTILGTKPSHPSAFLEENFLHVVHWVSSTDIRKNWWYVQWYVITNISLHQYNVEEKIFFQLNWIEKWLAPIIRWCYIQHHNCRCRFFFNQTM